jgi:hypothetical protein
MGAEVARHARVVEGLIKLQRLVRQGRIPKPDYSLGPRSPRWDREALDASFSGGAASTNARSAVTALAQKIEQEGVRVVRRVLADGQVKEYRYRRDRPKRPEQPQIVADTLGSLVKAYRRSPEWASLKPSTQYIRNIDLLSLEQLEQLKVADIKRRERAWAAQTGRSRACRSGLHRERDCSRHRAPQPRHGGALHALG